MYANNLDDAFSVFASGTTEEWVKSDKYMDYPKYHDEDYTYIEGRTIGDIAAQISVQGEAYSQYISFMMDRYYDGIDLMGMSIWIHYELKDGSGSEDSPVNVMYNDSTIRFNWIIPEKATQQSGDIKIGVWVNGTAPNTKAYILKTEEKIYTIHSGLIPGSGITQPDQNWFENFVEQMDSKVSTAQGHANDAQASKTAAAGSAAASAQSATASAQALADNKAYVESQKAAFVGYNKRETDLRYANALIGSASDTTQVTVDDAWEAPIPGLEIAGKSEQGADPSPDNPQEIVSTDVTAVTVTGAQVIPYPYLDTTKTSNGVTFTDMGNGGIKITGTITNKYTTFTLNNNLFLPPGIYTKNVFEEFGLAFLISRYINNKYDTIAVRANDKTFDTSSWDYNKYEYRVLIQVTELETFNTIFYPMINRGDTALPWEPYQSKTAAITLTEPLRGIGDVRDRIMCRDGVWGVERAINQIDDTGTVPISEALEVLDTPTWEPLTDETQAALNTLTTYKGRTTIAVTAEGPEPDVAVEYVQDTNVVIAELKKLIEGIQNVES